MRYWRSRRQRRAHTRIHAALFAMNGDEGLSALGGIWSRFVNNDNTVAVGLTAGVIMRRRSRHNGSPSDASEWPLPPTDSTRGAAAEIDATLDEALRALARLLARQAAREVLDREPRFVSDDQPGSEDPQ
jgi:hypothetical protein